MKRYASLIVGLAGLPAVSAAPLSFGTYHLHSHPDGAKAPPSYGLRLDELFNVTQNRDSFTFDFDAPGSAMYLRYTPSTIRIFGVAFGGYDTGVSYHPDWSGLWDIDVSYTNVVSIAGGDDDVIVYESEHVNSGFIHRQGDEEIIDLFDYAGNHGYTFQLGDEGDDQGHRGFAGISGWGWLNHRDPNKHTVASDWIFTVGTRVIPSPEAGLLGLLGLGTLAAARRR